MAMHTLSWGERRKTRWYNFCRNV